jgi:hypothetical protein
MKAAKTFQQQPTRQLVVFSNGDQEVDCFSTVLLFDQALRL